MTEYPQVFRVRQEFARPRVEDVAAEVVSQLSGLGLAQKIKPGQSVAVTAGSRGIANISRILQATIGHLTSLGAEPFLVPAMGSHGGGTAESQQALLEGYGITESSCGCPIRSSMETVVVCQAAEGFPVYFDRFAFEADHVIVCGRVKPHTNFTGYVESGLMKMLLIGLGKHDGAKVYHRAIADFSFPQIVRSVSRDVLAKCPITAGIAILENAYDETALIEALPAAAFEAREPQLLQLARQWMPRLPFEDVDVLLVDEIGKNVSGTGVDTNVVGRKYGIHRAGPDEVPRVRYISVRGLTDKTRGNATGLGMAEFCRSRVLRARNEEITRINCFTGGHAFLAMAPVDFETDGEILDAIFPLLGLTEPRDARLLWIRNTLSMIELECSAAYLELALSRSDLEIIRQPRALPVDAAGNLPDFVTDLND